MPTTSSVWLASQPDLEQLVGTFGWCLLNGRVRSGFDMHNREIMLVRS